MTPQIRTPHDAAEALAFIAREQATAHRGTAYLSQDPRFLEASLDTAVPGWRDRVQVAVEDGTVVGAAIPRCDRRHGVCHVYGPWADGEGTAWATRAGALLDHVGSHDHAAISRLEARCDVGNSRLEDLLRARGWQPESLQHVYLKHFTPEEMWREVPRTRPATLLDLALIHELHDAEFPATYTSARELIEDQARVTVVVESPEGEVLGYASGHLRPEGRGHLDYMAVHPAARGLGDGRLLLAAAGNALLDRTLTNTVTLAVDDERVPAQRFYESVGFTRMCSFRIWAKA